jgi:hypothetical protein
MSAVKPPRVYQVLGLLRYLWNADVETRHALEHDGGKIRDLFDVSDPLRIEIDDLLGPEDDHD